MLIYIIVMLNKNKINFFISLTISTLLITPVALSWFDMVHFPIGNTQSFLSYSNFYYPLKYSHVDYVAILIILLISPPIIFALNYFFYGKRFSKILLNIAIFIIIILNLNVLRRDIYPFLSFAEVYKNIYFFIFLLIFIIFLIYYFKNFIKKILNFFFIIFSPFYIIFLINYAYAIYLTKPDYSKFYEYDTHLAKTHKKIVEDKVILIIFDELDYRLLFEMRENNLQLPNIDKLIETSFFATNAIPPANETMLSLPQITNGHKIFDVYLRPGNKVEILDDEKNILQWRDSKNIFKILNENKINNAVIGQAGLPYCKIFDKYLNICWEHGIEWSETNYNLLDAFYIFSKETLLSFPLLNSFLNRNKNIEHFEIQRFKKIMAVSKETIKDQNIDFTLLHFNVPHNPYFFNMANNTFDTSMFDKPEGYIHSLKLVDNIVGELIETINLNYDFNNINLIITSDHSCRSIYCPILDELNLKQDFRVPFILKLKNQKTKYLYEEEFQIINIMKIIRGILDKNITNPKDIIDLSID
jgi:hypothetical protein